VQENIKFIELRSAAGRLSLEDAGILGQVTSKYLETAQNIHRVEQF
jgi:hypothetical protein